MRPVHSEILTKEQTELLFLIQKFKKDFGLVGGTAAALYIGHRESIDFDLFSPIEFNNARIQQAFYRADKKIEIIRKRKGEFTFIINSVKITFFYFPYPVNYTESFRDIIKLPTLLTLAAMKAFAFGNRAKWKDYVDMYFIMRDYHSFAEIVKKAEELFNSQFNSKLFRQQLAYFNDIDYREKIIFRPGFETSEEKIKKSLIDFSLI